MNVNGIHLPLPDHWKSLQDETTLRSLIDRRKDKAIAIFKHSTRCSRSHFAMSRLMEQSLPSDPVDFYFLDLLSFRSLSNTVAQELQTMHQSPQLILVRDGSVVYHASHESINWRKALAQLSAQSTS
jgi:bacillithiol system protein YtxJ